MLSRYALSYLKWVDTSNTLKTYFLIKDDKVWEKYENIWDMIKNKLSIKFHSKPVYEQKYLKVKVREFDGVIKTNFLGNGTPKENMHYTRIMRMDKKTIGRFI